MSDWAGNMIARNSVRGPRIAALLKTTFLVSSLALASVTSSAAIAQSVSGISVKGNQRIETATILSYLADAQGGSPAEINAAVQALRATGLFEEVDASVSGGRLTVTVQEYPTINLINFEGNDKLSDADLSAVVQSTSRRVYNPATVETDVATIADYYATKGRINATVTPKIIRRSDNRVDLVYEIFEGGITEIESIGFVGNLTFSDRRLRSVLSTKQAGILRLLISRDTYDPARVDFDKQVLTDFYTARGFVDFRVENVDIELTRERDAYLVTFNVEEGQRYRMGAIDIVSEINGVDAELFRREIKVDAGDYYSPVAIENDIARIESLALRQGVDFLRVDPQITRNEAGQILDVTYVLTRGERIFVERIDIEGNNTTLDRVVRDQFRVVEGDPFNPRSIRESAERIRALGYFANADVQARQGSGTDQVVIDVNVEEMPTGSFSFGVNYNTDTGASLVGTFKEQNFLGRGQQIFLNANLGKTNRQFTFDFTEPYLLGRDLSASLGLSYVTTNNEGAKYDTKTFRFSPSLGFPITEQARLSTFYALEYSSLQDVDAAASTVIKADEAKGGIWANSVGYNLSWDNRRKGVEPEVVLVARGGQEFGFGKNTYVKNTFLAGAETNVLSDQLTLRGTFEGGYAKYFKGSSRVIDRFMFGSDIMRGFQLGGIGPRDTATDDAIGGNAYAVVRLEAEFPLGLPEEYGMRGGAFVDYGSLWDPGFDCSSTTIDYCGFTPRSIAGLSLFWTTPLGPLRFNFTKPLSVQTGDNTRSFDLTISTQF